MLDIFVIMSYKSKGDSKKKPNLFDNIRKRKAAGKKMRKPGAKGAPTAKSWNKTTKAAAAKRKKK